MISSDGHPRKVPVKNAFDDLESYHRVRMDGRGDDWGEENSEVGPSGEGLVESTSQVALVHNFALDEQANMRCAIPSVLSGQHRM